MFIDLPLEKLKTYRGSTPCPPDFDAYWERALAELDGVAFAPELIESDFRVPNARCYDLYFTGVRGARIHAKYLRPARIDAPCPAVLQFHGYWDYSGNWSEKLAYVQSGFCVAALDVRGQGGLSEDTGGVRGNTASGQIIRGLDSPDPQDLLFRHIFLDTVALFRVVSAFDEVDASRVCCMGRSQGGALSLALAALAPEVRMVSATYPFLSDYKRVWELGLSCVAYAELPRYFRYFDPRHEREDAIFTKLGYIDIQNLTPRIRAEVLFFTGLSDDVCPPSTQFAAYNKIVSKKECFVYPDYTHEEIAETYDITYQRFLRLL